MFLHHFIKTFVKKGGKFICYKSERLTEELLNATKAISVLGGEIEEQVDYYLPFSDIYRNLLVIQKVKKTPYQYPRKAGIPSREPIKI